MKRINIPKMYWSKYENSSYWFQLSSKIMDFDYSKSYVLAPSKYHGCVWTIKVELFYRHPLEKPLRFWASSNFL